MLITVGDAVVIYALISYFSRHGLWTPTSSARPVLSVWGGLSFLLSLVTAIVGLAKEESPGYGTSALCLSLLSFLLYVQ